MTRNRTRSPTNPHISRQPKNSSNYPYRTQNISVTRNNSNDTTDPTTQATQTGQPKTKNLKIITWNANGLENKRSELKNLIADENPDIVAICEAKMDDLTINLLYEFREIGYFPYHKLRDSDGGGVVLLVKEVTRKAEEIKLTIDEQKTYQLDNEEIVGVRLKLEGKFYHIFCWYLPPEKPLNRKDFEFMQKCGNYILVGDLNSKLSTLNKTTNANGRKLQDIIDTNNCYVLNQVNQPTYIRKHATKSSYKSTLDLFIVSQNIEKLKRKIETLNYSAVSKHQQKWFHVPVMAVFDIKISKKFIRKSKISSFLYEKAKWGDFHAKLDQELIDVDHEQMPLGDLCEKIVEATVKAANASIPKSKPSVGKCPIKYPIHIINLIAEKRRLNYIFKLNPNKVNGETLKTAQIECGDAISIFNQSKWKEFIKKMGPHPLSTIPFWRRINRLRNKTQQQNVGDLMIDGLKITTNSGKAKVLADRLEGVFSSDIDPKDDRSNFQDINQKMNDGGIENLYDNNEKNTTTFSMQELTKAIKNINKKTSLDQNGISNRILRQVRHSRIAMECLLSLGNKCLTAHDIPTYWKLSTITMIHKKDTDTAEPKSYRPISVTPCLARFYERLVLARFKKFLRQRKFLIVPQSGFRDHRQTKDNIAYVTQKVQQGFSEKKKP
jgi:hypothetical protein